MMKLKMASLNRLIVFVCAVVLCIRLQLLLRISHRCIQQ